MRFHASVLVGIHVLVAVTRAAQEESSKKDAELRLHLEETLGRVGARITQGYVGGPSSGEQPTHIRFTYYAPPKDSKGNFVEGAGDIERYIDFKLPEAIKPEDNEFVDKRCIFKQTLRVRGPGRAFLKVRGEEVVEGTGVPSYYVDLPGGNSIHNNLDCNDGFVCACDRNHYGCFHVRRKKYCLRLTIGFKGSCPNPQSWWPAYTAFLPIEQEYLKDIAQNPLTFCKPFHKTVLLYSGYDYNIKGHSFTYYKSRATVRYVCLDKDGTEMLDRNRRHVLVNQDYVPEEPFVNGKELDQETYAYQYTTENMKYKVEDEPKLEEKNTKETSVTNPNGGGRNFEEYWY